MRARAETIAAQIDQLSKRKGQIANQVVGIEAQQVSLTQQLDLISKELADQQSLLEKGLMIELTPPGRGQIVTHHLYEADELEQIQGQSFSAPETRPSGGTGAPLPGSGVSSKLDELNDRIENLEQAVAELQEKLGSILN